MGSLKKDRLLAWLIIVAMLVLLVASLSSAQPISASGVGVLNSERRSSTATGPGVQAQAGNVTQLTINATRVTNHWQGYYGNVSGEIRLDDADANTLYAWTLANPTGEIFAVNTSSTVNWANVTCVNFSNATSASVKINQTTLDSQFGITASEVDGFNDTFTKMFAGSIGVGSSIIDGTDNCPLTYLFVNNQSQTTDYQEILMHDNLSALIFTAILEPHGTQGFDGFPWDFEMLVAQNDTFVGTYYFYVELS